MIVERGSHERSLIASTTKIMTGLIIAESCALSDEVQIPDSAIGVEGSSLYLQQGETRTVEELLYGMMLHSGNDAAAALAIHCAGSTDAFVASMNKKAQDIGLHDTSFGNPHGLDSEQNYSTAFDLAVLIMQAMKNDLFRTVVSTQRISFGSRTYTNHNKLLWQYVGSIGGKTGYTRAAGRILVNVVERDGRSLIAVTINAPDDWNDHRILYDYGFERFRNKQICSAGQVMARIPTIGYGSDYCSVIADQDINCLASDEEFVEYRLLLPDFVYLPIYDEYAGELEVYVDRVRILSVPLKWENLECKR